MVAKEWREKAVEEMDADALANATSGVYEDDGSYVFVVQHPVAALAEYGGFRAEVPEEELFLNGYTQEEVDALVNQLADGNTIEEGDYLGSSREEVRGSL